MERKARGALLRLKCKEGGGSGGGGGGGRSSGKTDGIGGGTPLTEPVLRGITSALRGIGPSTETTVLIAAHGKGKSDGAAALIQFMRRHAPDLADCVIGEGRHMRVRYIGTEREIRLVFRHSA